MFGEEYDFRGCDFFEISNISSFGGLHPSVYVVVYGDFDGKHSKVITPSE